MPACVRPVHPSGISGDIGNVLGPVVGLLIAAAAATAGCGGSDSPKKSAAPAPGGGKARAALERLDGERVAKRVSELRKLPFKQDVPRLSIITPDEVTSFLREQLALSYPEARFASDEAFYQLTGIIPADARLRDLVDEFASGLVVGFYDRKTPERLQLVTNKQAAEPDAAESVLAHELNHALQDQNFDLDKTIFSIKDTERRLAAGALVEGEATVIELAYGEEHLGGPPSAGAGAGAVQSLPPAFLLYGVFPYQAGAEFVQRLIKDGRGYELVDKAWRMRVPTTTEQVLHPKKYFAGERSRPVQLPAADALGGGWKGGGEQPFGELDALAVLSTKKLPEGEATRDAATGWDGGARETFTKGDEQAAAITTTWESPGEAREFAEAYETALEKDRSATRAKKAFEIPKVGTAVVTTMGRDVRIAIAPTAEQAAALAAP